MYMYVCTCVFCAHKHTHTHTHTMLQCKPYHLFIDELDSHGALNGLCWQQGELLVAILKQSTAMDGDVGGRDPAAVTISNAKRLFVSIDQFVKDLHPLETEQTQA